MPCRTIGDSIDAVRDFRQEFDRLSGTDPDVIFAINHCNLSPEDLDVVLMMADLAATGNTSAFLEKADQLVQNWRDVNHRQKDAIDRLTKKMLEIRGVVSRRFSDTDLNNGYKRAVREIKEILG